MIMAQTMLSANVDKLSSGKSVIGVVLLPLVVRAFGLVASCVALLVVRSEPRESPASALGRGLYVATLLGAIGVGGATYWMLGQWFMPFCLCGLLGVAASLALVAWGRSGWGSAAALAVVVVASWFLGEHSGLARAGRFGVAVAATGMLASAPFLASVASFGAIARSARAAIGAEGQAPSPRDRSEPLAAIGDAATAIARPPLAGIAALVAFLGASAFLDLASAYRCSAWAQAHDLPARDWSAIAAQCRASGAAPEAVSLANPILFAAALLGAVLVPVFIAQRSHGAEAAARRSVGSSEGLAGAAREALRQSTRPAVLFAAAPIAIGVIYTHAFGLGAEAIAALVFSAIAAAVSFSPLRDRAEAPPVPVKLLGALALALAPLFV
jgi:Na+/H+-translocating membrane pyrophosphatase